MVAVSGQHTAGSKGDIFTPVDLSGVAGQNDGDASVQEAMSSEVDKRMHKALDDLKVKYGDGDESVETSEHGPTGTAYRKRENEEAVQRRGEAREKAAQRDARKKDVRRQANERKLDEEGLGCSDEDSDNEGGVVDDELEDLRASRVAQLKAMHSQRLDDLAHGHGRYAEISQDEFLTDVLRSKFAAVHFYHDGFEKCKVMHHHLNIVAQKHISAKFMKLNAERAPFFVEKLSVQVLPTVIIFKDGKACARLVGYDGLTEGLEKGKEDEWKTERLQAWLAKTGIIEFEEQATEQEITQHTLAGMRAAAMRGLADNQDFADDDDLFDSDGES